MSNTIERLRALLSEATPGPWQAEYATSWAAGKPQLTEWFVRLDGDDVAIAADIIDPRHDDRPSEANARLICAAVNALPALLAVAEAAQALYDAMDDSRMQHPRPLEEHQARAALRVRLAELEGHNP